MEELATNVWMIVMKNIHALAHLHSQDPRIALVDPLVSTAHNINLMNETIFDNSNLYYMKDICMRYF